MEPATGSQGRAEQSGDHAAAVRAYCSRICPPDAVPEAVDAVLAAMEARDQDALLREATRTAAAERAATPGGAGRRRGASSLRARIADATGISACEVMPRLLAARASGTLSPREDERMRRHLQRCTACQEAELRFVEAEHAFDVERGVAPTEERRPVATEEHQPVATEERQPVATEERQPVATDERRPVATDERRPLTHRSSGRVTQPEKPGGEVPAAAAAGSGDRPRRVGRAALFGLAALLLLTSGIIAASTNLIDGTTDETGTTGEPGGAPVVETPDEPGRADGGGRPLPEPESVTVSVLNGADIELLAADIADRLEEEGFEIVGVENASRSTDETLVIRDGGTQREARRVARELDVSEVQSVGDGPRAELVAAAGGADVVVVTGPDAEQE